MAKKSNRKIHATTQKFTEIQDIVDDIVIFTNRRACLLIELTSVNFALLSPQEQDSKIFSYASLLNSLSFPIQIVIRSKKLDISNYLKLLDAQAMNRAQNEKQASAIKEYRNFVAELVKVNTVLDKKFHVVLFFSFLENSVLAKQNFEESAKAALHSKAQSFHSQLARLNLRAKTLDKEALVRLFYDLYNEDRETEIMDGFKSPVVKTGGAQ